MTVTITKTLLQKYRQWCDKQDVYTLIALLSLALKNKTSLTVQQLLFKFDIHPNIISGIENGDWSYQEIISFLSEDFESYE